MAASAFIKKHRSNLMQIVLLLAFAFYLMLGQGSRLYYCQRCGLKRHDHGYTWAKLPLSATWSTHYRETEYHRLYGRIIREHCDHIWRCYSIGYSPVGILGPASAGSGYLPSILLSRNGQELKKRIAGKDQTAAAVILREYDLRPSYAKRIEQ